MPLAKANDVRKKVYDVIVVGGGAAGLAVARSASESGLSTLIIEKGPATANGRPIVVDEIAPDSPHALRDATNFEALGGTLETWGGRAVPFDERDFEETQSPGVLSWPISYEEYSLWIAPASEFLGIQGSYEAPALEDWPPSCAISANKVERLTPLSNVEDIRKSVLNDSGAPDVLTESEAISLQWSDGTDRICTGVVTRDGTEITGRSVILACGGLEVTRILLSEQALRPEKFGGPEGALGRYYMGHLTGSIAEIEFSKPDIASKFAYDDSFTSARRRFTIESADQLGCAIWLENILPSDPRHHSGELSLKAMSSGRLGPQARQHLTNVLKDPLGAFHIIQHHAKKRRDPHRRPPDRLVDCGRGPYKLAYHGEHGAQKESKVRLSGKTDSMGRQLLRIDFRYSGTDFEAVLLAHKLLQQKLTEYGLGNVTFKPSTNDSEIRKEISRTARDGYHQIGLTRMSTDPKDGIVDANCRVHGTENLFVASSSIFPVSGQANPTLSIVALALRLARFLKLKHNDVLAIDEYLGKPGV